MSTYLHLLMTAHDAAMAAYDAQNDDEYDRDNDLTGKALEALRDAILNHRPMIDEVRIKAEFMARSKTFTVWDNFDQARLITALMPVAVSPQRRVGGERGA